MRNRNPSIIIIKHLVTAIRSIKTSLKTRISPLLTIIRSPLIEFSRWIHWKTLITITQQVELSHLRQCKLLWISIVLSLLHLSLISLHCTTWAHSHKIIIRKSHNKTRVVVVPNQVTTTIQAMKLKQHHYMAYEIKWRIILLAAYLRMTLRNKPSKVNQYTRKKSNCYLKLRGWLSCFAISAFQLSKSLKKCSLSGITFAIATSSWYGMTGLRTENQQVWCPENARRFAFQMMQQQQHTGTHQDLISTTQVDSNRITEATTGDSWPMKSESIMKNSDKSTRNSTIMIERLSNRNQYQC